MKPFLDVVVVVVVVVPFYFRRIPQYHLCCEAPEMFCGLRKFTRLFIFFLLFQSHQFYVRDWLQSCCMFSLVDRVKYWHFTFLQTTDTFKFGYFWTFLQHISYHVHFTCMWGVTTDNLWQQNQIFWAKTWCSPNPNQAIGAKTWPKHRHNALTTEDWKSNLEKNKDAT